VLALILAAASVVEGQVVAAATGQPLQKARVTLRGGRRSYGATSGAEGRFTITGIEAGRYRLTAERNGYIPQSYGTRLPGRPGAEIAFTGDDALRDVTLKLTAMAVVSGRITDDDAEPFPRVQVRALRMQTFDGVRRLVVVDSTRSDDRGEYRLFGLAPGRYWISAEPQRERRPGEPVQYATLYYPGAHSAREASAVEIAGGSEVRGVDFQIGPARTVSIRGRVILPQAGRTSGMVVLAQRDETPTLDQLHAVADSNGAFEIRGAVPGPYVITVRAPSGGAAGWGETRVDAGESGAEGVVIPLVPEFRLAGSVRAPAGVTLSAVRISLTPRNGAPPRGIRTESSGAFSLRGLRPDVYLIHADGLPEGTWISAFRLGTRDLPNAEVDLSQDPGVPLEIVLSDGAATVEGLVVEESNAPVVGATVALLPSAERLSQRRLLKFDTTDQHGRYSLAGIAPGEYTLIAWDGMDPDLVRDHDFLRGQLERGKPVSLSARDKQTVQMKAVAP
jgi:hypothetical protein